MCVCHTDVCMSHSKPHSLAPSFMCVYWKLMCFCGYVRFECVCVWHSKPLFLAPSFMCGCMCVLKVNVFLWMHMIWLYVCVCVTLQASLSGTLLHVCACVCPESYHVFVKLWLHVEVCVSYTNSKPHFPASFSMCLCPQKLMLLVLWRCVIAYAYMCVSHFKPHFLAPSFLCVSESVCTES